MTDDSPIQKHEQIIETAIVTYADTTYTDGEFTGQVIDGDVTLSLSNIDGSMSIRIPLAHLDRVRVMLDHIAADLT